MSAAAVREAAPCAQRWHISGRVQGVGFRPFVYRLAATLGVAGWVRNHGGGVEVQVQGTRAQLELFGSQLLSRAPPAARPQLLGSDAVSVQPCEGFAILASCADANADVHVPPDLFACDECLAELRQPQARRYRYPFINCTQCGPRYTLIRALPYDRPNTTMASFELCADCKIEYGNPLDRRFHAQPLACPRCGPHLHWSGAAQQIDNDDGAAVAACLAALARSEIVAARGIGGYHLLCDARSERAVELLRRRKHRPAKPLALMLPWRGDDGLDAVRAVAHLSALEASALIDPARPIVLVRRRPDAPLACALAPGLNEIGVMLPYSPLLHLLLDGFGRALVATSGNISGEPVLTEIEEAQQRLTGIADAFLHHNRPIARPADDPVVQVVAGNTRALRLGRGTAPLEFELAQPLERPTLAVGAYLKNTVALAWEARAVVSQHIGDLGTPRGLEVFEHVIADLQALYGVQARAIVHDAHPGFPNSRWAQFQRLPVQAVWHHHAHAAALAGEYHLTEPILCFTWDGVGLGSDGTLWGGEALLGTPAHWSRVASLRPFRLPGGERAARQPWRSALGLCWECGLSWPVGEARADPLLRLAFDRGLNAPATSAVGRLFDAAAALLGVCAEASYEGEAPMRLEALADAARRDVSEALPAIELPLTRDATGLWRADCMPLAAMLLEQALPAQQRALCFHASLAATLCRQAVAIRADTDVSRIGLCGGVFQNRLLAESAIAQLEGAGFQVLLPQRLPAGDAAISFGQIVEAAALCAAAAG